MPTKHQPPTQKAHAEYCAACSQLAQAMKAHEATHVQLKAAQNEQAAKWQALQDTINRNNH